jgi:hypothetical protein
MKTNQEILDEFGKILVNRLLDRYYIGIKDEIMNGCKNPTTQKFNQIFDELTHETKFLLKEYIFENINSVVFDVLEIFEENPEFKIIYEENGQQVDLNKISEMLKAEPIIENGWIKRFSNFKNE